MRNSPLLPREQSGQSRMPLVFVLVFLRGLKNIQPSTRLPPSGLSSHTRLGLLWAAPTTNHREPRFGEVERQECTQGRGSQVLKEMMWDPQLQPGGAPRTLAGEETGPPASPADTPQPRGQHGLMPRPLPRAPLPHPLTWGSSETQNGRTGCRDLTGHTSKVCEWSRAVKDRAPQAGPCDPHMRCGFQSRDQHGRLCRTQAPSGGRHGGTGQWVWGGGGGRRERRGRGGRRAARLCLISAELRTPLRDPAGWASGSWQWTRVGGGMAHSMQPPRAPDRRRGAPPQKPQALGRGLTCRASRPLSSVLTLVDSLKMRRHSSMGSESKSTSFSRAE